MKLVKAVGRKMDIMNKIFEYSPQIFIIIQLLVTNDLVLSVTINYRDLIFTNTTQSFSSIVTLILTVVLFTGFLAPMGIISNNPMKVLISDEMIAKVGIYYHNVLKFNQKAGAMTFLNYYVVYLMFYSVAYSLILAGFDWSSKVQMA
jgi:hypothetical protein